jgi:hypothetical protein
MHGAPRPLERPFSTLIKQMIGDDCHLRGPSPDGARDLAVDARSGAQAQAPKGLGAAVDLLLVNSLCEYSEQTLK